LKKNYFKPGDNVRFKFGLHSVFPDCLFNGFILPGTISYGDTGVSFTCTDFVSLLAEYGEPIRLDENKFNFNGWECSSAVEYLVNSLNGTPLTFSGSGTNPTRFIEAADELYFPAYATKLSVINAIVDLATDDDVDTQDFPLRYFYYQLNEGTTARFKFVKEQASPTAIRTFTGGTDLVLGSVTSNVEQFNVAVMGEEGMEGLEYPYEDAINKYKRITKIFPRKYKQRSRNLDFLRRQVHLHFQPNYSFAAEVLNGYSVPHLGDYITITNANNDLQNGTHLVTGTRYNISQSSVKCVLTLANKLTEF
jgi:hypothetical protein